MFSRPVSFLFVILYTNISMPGHFTDRNGNVSLINTICYITNFVVVLPISDETSMRELIRNSILINSSLLSVHHLHKCNCIDLLFVSLGFIFYPIFFRRYAQALLVFNENQWRRNKGIEHGTRKTGYYHVTFLLRYPSDNHICDDNAR